MDALVFARVKVSHRKFVPVVLDRYVSPVCWTGVLCRSHRCIGPVYCSDAVFRTGVLFGCVTVYSIPVNVALAGICNAL